MEEIRALQGSGKLFVHFSLQACSQEGSSMKPSEFTDFVDNSVLDIPDFRSVINISPLFRNYPLYNILL